MDLHEKLKNINKKVASNKTRHIEVEKELNHLSGEIELLSKNNQTFFLGKMYFTGDGFQNMFISLAFSTSQLKKGCRL